MSIIKQLEDYFHKSPLAFMKVVPKSSVIFDLRAKYKCKFGCKNYNRKYSCPPMSLELFKKIKEGGYQQAILFATTYEIPRDFSWYKKRFFNLQKEYEIQRIATQLNDLSKINQFPYVVLSGGPCRKCRECSWVNNEACKKPHLKQVSMEAIGIDCQKTMHKAGFDFQMPNIQGINRCGCIFIKNKLPRIELKKKESFQKFYISSKKEIERLCAKLVDEHPEMYKDAYLISTSKLDTKKVLCNQRCKGYGKNFTCPPYSDKIELKLWKNAVVWEWKNNESKKNRYNFALKRMHSAIFSTGHYFALSLRDCYCDECSLCTFSLTNKNFCFYRKIIAPSMQSQGINPASFGGGRFGLELF